MCTNGKLKRLPAAAVKRFKNKHTNSNIAETSSWTRPLSGIPYFMTVCSSGGSKPECPSLPFLGLPPGAVTELLVPSPCPDLR